MEENNVKTKKSRGSVVLFCLSVLIMVIAVSMIYMYTRQQASELLEVSAGTQYSSEDVESTVQDSSTAVEAQSAPFNVHNYQDSGIFIIGSGVFMLVIVVSFGIVKFVENKEE